LSAREDRVRRFAAALRRGSEKIRQTEGRDFEREAREICEQLAALDRVDDIVIDGETDQV
jgi:hypothetical protein